MRLNITLKILLGSILYWVPVAMFSAYPVLSLYGGNAEMLDLPILIRPLAFSMALAVVVYPFFWRFTEGSCLPRAPLLFS